MPVDNAFFDTSILVYVVLTDDLRSARAEDLLMRGGRTSVQVLNELTAVMRRKYSLSWPRIRQVLADVRRFCGEPLDLTSKTHESGIAIAERYRFHFYDSLIVASALDAGCTTLYTEDLQHNQRIDTLTVINPFLAN